MSALFREQRGGKCGWSGGNRGDPRETESGGDGCVCVCEITVAFVRSLALSLIEMGRYWRVPIREKHHVTWGFTELVWWLCGD